MRNEPVVNAERIFAVQGALKLLPAERRTVEELKRHCRDVLGIGKKELTVEEFVQRWGDIKTGRVAA